MLILREKLRSLCRRGFAVGVSFIAFGLAVAPAQADVTQVMREVERAGTARVIITMKTGETTRGRWAMAQSVDQQRRIVASANAGLEQRMRGARIPLTRRYATLPYAGAVVDAEQLASLVKMPEVASVRLVEVEKKAPNPSLETHSSVSLNTSIASIDVPDAWAAGYTGQNTTIAVLDGGFRTSHPMLNGKSVGDACFSDKYTDTRGNTIITPRCPSGQTPQIGTGAASNCPLGSDRCDHGTHVASIAVGNDGTNFGVAKGAKLMPIDVFSSDSDKDDCAPDPAPCEVTDSIATLDALDYVNDNAATYNIVAVNMSLGGDLVSGYCDDDPRKAAIDNLRAKGIAVMIASGNDGSSSRIETPGCISTALAVGATDNATNVASFSNFTSTVDLMAPGDNITAASGSNDGQLTLSGTSMATPHVAGAWAVMRSAFPNATADQLEQALKSAGTAVKRSSTGVSVPKIQVMRAINLNAGRATHPLYNQIVSSNASTLGQSFVRVYNSSATAGTVTFTVRDAGTGTALGTWTSPPIPPHASPQFGIVAIERDAVPVQGQTVAAAGRSYYNIEAASTFGGYVQYVLWSNGIGILNNLTSCPTGVSSDATTLLNVDSSNTNEYVSHIRIINAGSLSGAATLAFYDPDSGQQIATWTSSSVQPGASIDVTVPQIEAAVPDLAAATKAGRNQYNIGLTNLVGRLQHVMENRLVGVITDMSAKCELSGS
jgi:subtilisin family serine protease